MAKKLKKEKVIISEKQKKDFVTGLISKELDVIIALEISTIKDNKNVDINSFGSQILTLVKNAKKREDVTYRFWNLFDIMH